MRDLLKRCRYEINSLIFSVLIDILDPSRVRQKPFFRQSINILKLLLLWKLYIEWEQLPQVYKEISLKG